MKAKKNTNIDPPAATQGPPIYQSDAPPAAMEEHHTVSWRLKRAEADGVWEAGRDQGGWTGIRGNLIS